MDSKKIATLLLPFTVCAAMISSSNADEPTVNNAEELKNALQTDGHESINVIAPTITVDTDIDSIVSNYLKSDTSLGSSYATINGSGNLILGADQALSLTNIIIENTITHADGVESFLTLNENSTVNAIGSSSNSGISINIDNSNAVTINGTAYVKGYSQKGSSVSINGNMYITETAFIGASDKPTSSLEIGSGKTLSVQNDGIYIENSEITLGNNSSLSAENAFINISTTPGANKTIINSSENNKGTISGKGYHQGNQQDTEVYIDTLNSISSGIQIENGTLNTNFIGLNDGTDITTKVDSYTQSGGNVTLNKKGGITDNADITGGSFTLGTSSNNSGILEVGSFSLSNASLTLSNQYSKISTTGNGDITIGDGTNPTSVNYAGSTGTKIGTITADGNYTQNNNSNIYLDTLHAVNQINIVGGNLNTTQIGLNNTTGKSGSYSQSGNSTYVTVDNAYINGDADITGGTFTLSTSLESDNFSLSNASLILSNQNSEVSSISGNITIGDGTNVNYVGTTGTNNGILSSSINYIQNTNSKAYLDTLHATGQISIYGGNLNTNFIGLNDGTDITTKTYSYTQGDGDVTLNKKGEITNNADIIGGSFTLGTSSNNSGILEAGSFSLYNASLTLSNQNSKISTTGSGNIAIGDGTNPTSVNNSLNITGTISADGNYEQRNNSNVYLDTLHATEQISIYGGNLNTNFIGLNDGTDITTKVNSYTQSAGNVTLNKKGGITDNADITGGSFTLGTSSNNSGILEAGSFSLYNASLTLSNQNSKISTTGSGNIAIGDGTNPTSVNYDGITGNKKGTLSAGGNYTQNSNSNVYVDTLHATGNMNISGGTFNTNFIGLNNGTDITTKINSYTQSGGNVTLNKKGGITNNADITGGIFTIENLGSFSAKNFSIIKTGTDDTKLILKEGAQLSTNLNGNITIGADDENWVYVNEGTNNGVLSADGKYIQNKSASSVYLDTLYAKDELMIEGGDLNTNYIGLNDGTDITTKAGKYTQNSGTVTLNKKGGITDTAVINGGILNIGNGANFEVGSLSLKNDSYINLNNSSNIRAVESISPSTTGNITISDSAKVNPSFTKNGTLSADGSYTQKDNSNVYVDTLHAKGSINISGGNLNTNTIGLNNTTGKSGSFSQSGNNTYVTVDNAYIDGLASISGGELNISNNLYVGSFSVSGSNTIVNVGQNQDTSSILADTISFTGGTINLHNNILKASDSVDDTVIIRTLINYTGENNYLGKHGSEDKWIKRIVIGNKGQIIIGGSEAVTLNMGAGTNGISLESGGNITINNGSTLNLTAANGDIDLRNGTISNSGDIVINDGNGFVYIKNINDVEHILGSIESNGKTYINGTIYTNYYNQKNGTLINSGSYDSNKIIAETISFVNSSLNITSLGVKSGLTLSTNNPNGQITFFANSDTTIGPDNTLILNSTDNSTIEFKTGATLSNQGTIEIQGSGTTIFNNSINDSSNKTGTVNKTGDGVLTFGNTLYGNNFNASEGSTNVNENMTLAGNYKQTGGSMSLASNKTLSTGGYILTKGSDITLNSNSTLSATGDINISTTSGDNATNINYVSSTVHDNKGSISTTGNYTQDNSSNVYLDTLYAQNEIRINDGNLNTNYIGLNSDDNITAKVGSYIQSGGTVTLNKKGGITNTAEIIGGFFTLGTSLEAGSFSVDNATLTLSNTNSNITAVKSSTTSGNITIGNGTNPTSVNYNASIGSKKGTLSAGGSYTQNNNSNVYVDTLHANDDIYIYGGSLETNKIGISSEEKSGSYHQSGSANVTIDKAYINGDAEIAGGSSFALGTSLEAGSFSADNATITLSNTNSNITAVKSSTTSGNITIGKGTNPTSVNYDGSIGSKKGTLSAGGNYAQNNNSNVYVDTLHANDNIYIYGGSLETNKIGISSEEKSGSYHQSGSANVTVDKAYINGDAEITGGSFVLGTSLEAGSFSVDNAAITLSNTNSNITAVKSSTTSGNITIGNGTNPASVNYDGLTGSKKGTLSAGGSYTQNNNSNVYVDTLHANDNIYIYGGSLETNKIGISSEEKSGSYHQSGSANVTVDKAYINGDAEITGGSFVLGTSLNAGSFSLSNSSLTLTNTNSNITAVKSSTTSGNITIGDGTNPTSVNYDGLTGSKKGTLSAGGSYTQNSNSNVYVDTLHAKGNINISGGTLNTNTIGLNNTTGKSGSYSQSGNDTNVTVDNVYLEGAAEITGGTLNINNSLYSNSFSTNGSNTVVNIGQNSATKHIISATDNINLTDGTINLNNTEFQTPNNVTIGAKLIYTGNENYLGKYGSTPSYIKGVEIKNGGIIEIGDGAIATTLNMDAGTDGISLKAGGTIYNKEHSTLNLTAHGNNIDFRNGILNNAGTLVINNGGENIVKLKNINDSGNVVGTIESSGKTEISGSVYTDIYEQKAGSLEIKEGNEYNQIIANIIDFDDNSELKVNTGKYLTLGIKESPTTGTITFKDGSTTNVNGTLTLDATNGSIEFEEGSTVTNAGSLNIQGTGNTTFNTAINTSAQGIINKDGSGILNFNDDVHTGKINIGGSGKINLNDADLYIGNTAEIGFIGDRSLVNLDRNHFIDTSDIRFIKGYDLDSKVGSNTIDVAKKLIASENTKVTNPDNLETTNLIKANIIDFEGTSSLEIGDTSNNVAKLSIETYNTSNAGVEFESGSNINVKGNGELTLDATYGNFNIASKVSNAGLITVEGKKDVNFTNTDSELTNSGTLLIKNSGKTTIDSFINYNTTSGGTKSGTIEMNGGNGSNLYLNGDVYTEIFAQTSGNTTLDANMYTSDFTGNMDLITITAGHFIQIDDDLIVEDFELNSDDKTSLTATGNLEVKKGGTISITNPNNLPNVNNIIQAKNITFGDNTNLLVGETGNNNAIATIKMNTSTGSDTNKIQFNSTSTIDVKDVGYLTLDETNGDIDIEGTFKNAGTVRLYGTNTSKTVEFKPTATITNSGEIINQTNGNTIFNTQINSSTNKIGSIQQNGSGILTLNKASYLDNFVVNDGTVNVNESMSLSTSYSQNGGSLSLGNGKEINSDGSISIKNAKITLGDNSSKLSSVESISISGGSAEAASFINYIDTPVVTHNNFGTISTNGTYTQGNSGTKVYVNTLHATDTISINNGTLDTNYIGLNDGTNITTKSGSYTQNGGNVILNKKGEITNAVDITGGTFTLGTSSNNLGTLTAGSFSLANAALTLSNANSNITAIKSYITDGNIVIGNGTNPTSINYAGSTGTKIGTITAGGNYTQNNNSNIYLDTLHAQSQININGGTFEANKIGKSNTVKSGSYNQTGDYTNVTVDNVYVTNAADINGGTFTLGTSLEAGSFSVDNATLTLSNANSNITAIKSPTTDGNIVIGNGTNPTSVNYAGSTGTKIGTITAGGNYTQNNNSNVYLDTLHAQSQININGGTFEANKIGKSNTVKSGSYNQTGDYTNVTVDNVYVTNAADINGGTFTLGTSLEAGSFSVDNATLTLSNANSNITTIPSGTTNGDISIGSSYATYVNTPLTKQGTIYSGGNYTQNNANTKVYLDTLHAVGGVNIENGTLEVNKIGKSNTEKSGSYSQANNSSVNLKNAYIKGHADINSGSLDIADNGSFEAGSIHIGNTKINLGTTAAGSVSLTGIKSTQDSTTGDITIDGAGLVNYDTTSATGTKRGNINAGGKYTQSGANSKVFVDTITSVGDFSISNGELTANSIASKDSPTGNFELTTNGNVEILNGIYSNSITQSGSDSTLTLGNKIDLTQNSVLSATKNISLADGTVNLYNTTMEATTDPASLPSEKDAVNISATINYMGTNNNLGKFGTTSDPQYISNIKIENNGVINIGNTTNNATLNIDAGVGGVSSSGQIVLANNDSVLNLTAQNGDINFANGTIKNAGTVNIKNNNSTATGTVKLGNVNSSNSIAGDIISDSNTEVNGIIYTNTYKQKEGTLEITEGGVDNNKIIAYTTTFDKTGTNGSILNVDSETGLTLGIRAKKPTETENGKITFKNGTTANVEGTLKLDSTNGSIEFATGSTVFNTGEIKITGSGDTTFNTAINGSGNKKGDVTKDGSGTLTFNDKINGKNLDVSGGEVTFEDNATFTGTAKIDNTIAEIAEGKKLSATNDINLGSIDNWDTTTITLNSGASIESATELYINATVNAYNATLKGNNVTIADTSTLNIKGGGTTVINANNGSGAIKVSDATINVKEGSILKFLGNVESETAHYSVDNTKWIASGGTYSNKNYNGDDNGGAILYNGPNGNVTLDSANYSFQGSNTTTKNGGAVYNEGKITYSANTTDSHTSYTNNKAGYDYDGVIQNVNSQGGAIYNANTANNKYEIGYNTSFTNNIAAKDGGAVYNAGTFTSYFDENNNVYASNINFENNKAGYDLSGNQQNEHASGGAIYNEGTLLLGDSATFKNNESTDMGGAIYNKSGTATIGNNSKFEGNNTKTNGGAIYIEAGKVSIGSGAVLEGNKAGYHGTTKMNNSSDGGAVYVKEGSTAEFSNNTKFENNVATQNGGAIYNDGNVIFTYDSTKTTPAQEGYYGTEFNGNGKFNNTVTQNGGAIYITENGQFTSNSLNGTATHSGIYRAIIDNNSATQAGGGIYNANTTNELRIVESRLTGNNSTDGGAIYNNGTVTFESTLLTDNSASTNGGAIYNIATGIVNINAGTKLGETDHGNTANIGGAIYNTGTLNNNGSENNVVSYVGNKATSKGGAIYNNNAMTTTYTNFDSNQAGSTDPTNPVAGQGGAIYNENAIITLDGETAFSNNTVIGTEASNNSFAKGGAIYNAGTGKVIINDTKFTSNSSDGYGGAIYNSTDSVLEIHGDTVIGGSIEEEDPTTNGNSALRGGAVYNEGILDLTTATIIYFVGNTASEQGGAIFNKSTTPLNINNTSFIKNKTTSSSSEGYGGAIYNDENSNMTIGNGTVFDANSADYGAAIYNAGTMTIAKAATFENNTGTSAIGNEGTLTLGINNGDGFEFGNNDNKNSGALWNTGDGTISVTTHNIPNPSDYIQVTETEFLDKYSLYVHNTGDGTVDGAALHSTGDSLIQTDGTNNKITNGVFILNNGKNGGAIYNDSTEKITLENTVFSQNTSAIDGGAIYNTNQDSKTSEIYIDNDVRFYNNSATGKGGAIYNKGDNAVIEFAENYTMGTIETGLYHNSAKEAGGAIANEGILILNAASSDENSTSINMYHQGGLYEPNLYTNKGGALYMSGPTASITTNYTDGSDSYDGLSNALFSNNEASNGGAIYNDVSSFNIRSTTFTNNTAQNEGGAIHNAGGNIGIEITKENAFNYNHAGNSSTTGSGGAIFNTGNLVINSDSPVTAFYRNSANSGGAIYNQKGLVFLDGNMTFANNQATNGGAITIAGISSTLPEDDAVVYLDGNIKFENNEATDGDAAGNAIYFGGVGGQLIITNLDGQGTTITFSDKNPDDENSKAQTIASAPNTMNIIDVRENTVVNFESDGSNYRGAYNQSGGIVNVSNKFLNVDKNQTDFTGVRGGTIVFKEGSQLSSDDLIITNAIDKYTGTAKVVFEENSKAKLTDLSALYQSTANGTFTYGDKKLALSGADVEINDTATLTSNAEIGYNKAVRNLSLSNGVDIQKQIRVDGSTNTEHNPITLKLGDGVTTTSDTNIILNNKSTLDLENNTDEIQIKGTISSNDAANSNIIKSNNGTVTFENGSDASGFIGTYTQNGGKVEFKDGSKFFGNGAKNTMNGGSLVLNDNVTFKDDNSTVITMNDNTGLSTDMKTDVHIIANAAGNYVDIYDDASSTARANLIGKNIDLDVKGESTIDIDTTNGPLIIGKDETFEKLDADSESDKQITINVGDNDPRFILHNEDNEDGVGELTLGNNVTITGAPSIVVDMMDNTKLTFKDDDDITRNVEINTISGYGPAPDYTSTIENNWATTRGNIIKDGKGTLTINGDVDDFHGTLIYKDGTIELSPTTDKFAENVEYDLSKIVNDANIKVNNITKNNDIILTGDIANPDITSYKLNIKNTTGGIKSDATPSTSNVYIKNSEDAVIDVAGDINLNNAEIVNSSTTNLTAGGLVKLDDVNIDNSKTNVKANGGNLTFGKTNVKNESTAYVLATGNVTFGDTEIDKSKLTTSGTTITQGDTKVTNESEAVLSATGNVTLGATDIDKSNVEISGVDVTYGNTTVKNVSNLNTIATGNVNIGDIDIDNSLASTKGVDVTYGNMSVKNSSPSTIIATGDVTIATVDVDNNSEITTTGHDVNYGDTDIKNSSISTITATGDVELGNTYIDNSKSTTTGASVTYGDTVVKNTSTSTITATSDAKLGNLDIDNASFVSTIGSTVTIDDMEVKNNSNSYILSEGDVTLKNVEMDNSLASIKAGSEAQVGNVQLGNVDVKNNSQLPIIATGAVILDNWTVDTNSKSSIEAQGDVILDDMSVVGISTSSITTQGDVTLNDLKVDTQSTEVINTPGTITMNSASVKDSSLLNLNAPMTNVANDFLLKESTLMLQRGNLSIGGNFTMGSTVNMMAGSINTQSIAGNMILTGNSNYLIDINPAAYTSDRVIVNGTIASDTEGTTRTLTVSDYNLMSDAPSEVTTYDVFSNNGHKDVSFTATNKVKSTNIADYMLVSAGGGKYNLVRTNYNPNVMATSVASQGAFLTQVESYDTAFSNLDTVMNLPILGARENKNRYAASDIDETIVYSPLFIPELQKGIWFRPYGHFERDNYQNGPKTDTQLYGFLVGFDSPLKELKNDFMGTVSGYVGYNGLHQKYSNVSNYQNGGMIGVTGALYKGGFFSGLTANVNLGMNSTSTNLGKNNNFMLSTGIASKTGYNWELARGRFIVQPNFLVSYTLVNAFNPKDPSTGIKMNTTPLQAVQIAPGLKLIGNLPHGWQPYLTFDFRWNLGDKAKYKVGDIALPETFTRPYIEYGAGLQKRWGDRFTGYGQVLARHIGRNGVGLNLGLRWSVGK